MGNLIKLMALLIVMLMCLYNIFILSAAELKLPPKSLQSEGSKSFLNRIIPPIIL